MILSTDDARLFIKLYTLLTYFVNQRLDVIPNVGSENEFARLDPELRSQVRNRLIDELELIDSYVQKNPYQLARDELEIVLSWKHSVVGTFVVYRQLKKHMIFLAADTPTIAYGVVALKRPIGELSGRPLPMVQETMLMPFKGRIIYDGLLSEHNIVFGDSIKQTLANDYREATEQNGIVISLP